MRGQAKKHEESSSFRTWENLLSSETCSQELPQKKSFFPLNYRFMDGAPQSMFYCSAISRTLTCFLVYTLSTRWSAITFAFVRIYFEFSAATDNVFLFFLVAVLIPVILMLWCGIIKHFKVWIVSNSSLKVLFYFHFQMTKALKNIRNALKMDMNQSFFLHLLALILSSQKKVSYSFMLRLV